MNSGIDKKLQALKEALHTLKDTGADGFEGLLAAVLSDICGQPFRLASSGSQRGRDGDSAFDAGATYFEAKLYQDAVPRAAVSNKILELSVDDQGQVDTWVLCATSPISTQHVDLYRNALAKAGIGCLILDWPDHTLPSLAVLFAMAASATEQFLNDHSTDTLKVVNVGADLKAIAADCQFAAMSDALRDMLREPTLSLGIAKAANKSWLSDAFSDRRRARQFFGQPLAPLDSKGLAWVERAALVASLSSAFSGVPDDTVFVVIGDEGTGKSWLAAKAWLDSNPPPLLAVFTAEELQMPAAMNDLDGILIERLSAQTGSRVTEAQRLRWQRRFKGWRVNPRPNNIRLIVWVDGLNQAQEFPWPRWIDAASKTLSELGGRVIVTTNQRHFARIRSVVVSQVRRVIVEEWSAEELKSILSSRAILSDRLSADVFDSLRNPRILGIAMELLDAKDIEKFDELTVGRLLFEHIRRCQRDGTTDIPAEEFVKGLRTHADTIVERLYRQQHDDLTLFGLPLDDRLKAVSQSRFFKPVVGDPDLYAITDDGLPLALGLSLINSLRAEHRNARDPAARLADIIEPILALAKTSEVILSALQVACLEGDCPAAVLAALARYYVSLQNVPETQWPAFESVVRATPEPFVEAARDAALSNTHLPNMRWLTIALLSARSDPAGQRAASTQAVSWMSLYSLAPEQRMFTHQSRDPAEKVAGERAKRQAELDAKLSALSETERSFMETRLVASNETRLFRLHLLAFELLAGMRLADFSEALVNWAFANALNPAVDAPVEQFQHLIRFNHEDWREAREALLRSAASFTSENMSATAEWALVTILRATGDPEDAARADEIAERLTKDRPRFPTTLWLDAYSETDPCDPGSVRPENLDRIVAACERLDVSHLREGMGNTPQDHLFSTARPALARFQPQTVIAVQRRFARHVADRDGLPRRQGMLALLPASAILEPETVDRLVVSAGAAAGNPSDTNSIDHDVWITAQYALFAALPHKSGNEQLAIVAALPGRALLLLLLDQLRPADERVVEDHLKRALQSGDADELVRIMSFVLYSRSPLSGRSRRDLSPLLKSPDKMVRMQALGISARLRDQDLLKQIAESGWDAKSLDPEEDYFELWYGSSALLAAAEEGVLDPVDAVGRIAVNFYGFAMQRLGAAGAKAAMGHINANLKRAANLTDIPEFPLVEQPIPGEMDLTPPLLSLVDEFQPTDVRKVFERLNESEEAFQARQKRAWHAFDRVSKQLTVADARIVLDDFSWAGFEAMVSAEPALAKSWATLLCGLPGRTFRSLHFFALGLAKALAKIDAASAAALFQRLGAEAPLINRVVGPSKVPAEAIAVWSNADVREIKVLCFQRLDLARSDDELAVEVLAAFSAGAQAAIVEYVNAKLVTGEPEAIARSLMVSGFSDVNPHTPKILEKFAGKRVLSAARTPPHATPMKETTGDVNGLTKSDRRRIRKTSGAMRSCLQKWSTAATRFGNPATSRPARCLSASFRLSQT
jgi:hypothetical protein